MRLSVLLLVALSFVTLNPGPSSASEPDASLAVLARVGPWPAVSRLIGFDGRLWFANSVKYRNHNSADIYSFEPGSRELRYETHFFSQDAGRPTVAYGRLYWPFEDARFSTGRAEFMASDGSTWDWRTIPRTEAFHLHAMQAGEDGLYAATSSWKGRILHSTDQGVTWQLAYEHTNREGVSRVTVLGAHGDHTYAGMTAWRERGPKLLRGDASGFQPVPGWPDGQRVDAIVSFRGQLYANNQQGDDFALLRTNGESVERISALDGQQIRALTANAEIIVAVSGADGTGKLWQSRDGMNWQAAQQFADALPIDVTFFNGQLYVGAIGADGKGVLYGPEHPSAVPHRSDIAGTLPPPVGPPEEEIPAAFERLDMALADPDSYGHQLPSLFEDLAASRAPTVGAGFAQRLNGIFPEGDVALFGGALEVPARVIGRWALLNAIARNGNGDIPPALLMDDWQETPNGAEKYLTAMPAAVWAVSRTGQRDNETLGALIKRLARLDDPDWLEGDIVGALTALSGERFGYDPAAWRKWWAARKQD